MATDPSQWAPEERAWFATYRAHPEWTYAQIARWHGVERKLILRSAARRGWGRLRATDPDAVAPPWVDLADVPPWMRQRGESDHDWGMFSAWLSSPSHDLHGVAAAFGVPVWEVTRAMRLHQWQARLDAWRAEQARQSRYQVEASDLLTRRELSRVVSQHARSMSGLLDRLGERSPDKAIEAYTQLLTASRLVPLPEPIGAGPQITPGDANQIASERGRVAARLEAVCEALVRAVQSGDREAARLLLAFEKRRAEVLGLDEPAMTRGQIEGELEEAEQLREAWGELQAARAEDQEPKAIEAPGVV